MTCRSRLPVCTHVALPETNLWRQAAIEDITGPTDSRERVAGAAVGHRVRVLLAIHLQNEGALAAILDDPCMHFRFNQQHDSTIYLYSVLTLRILR